MTVVPGASPDGAGMAGDALPPGSESAGRGTIAFLVLAAGFVVVVALWAILGTLEVVSTAIGEVVPGSSVKTVQHLEGGIVREILVQERQVVKAGEPLVRLDSTRSDSDVDELQARLRALRIDIARLEAEIAASPGIDFPADLVATVPEQLAAAEAMMETRRKRLGAELEAQSQAVIQREQEIQEVEARIQTNRTLRSHLQEQVRISKQLLDRDITNRMTHLNLVKDLTSIEGQLQEDAALLNRTRAALEEARNREEEVAERFSEEARRQLGEHRREFEELSQRLRKFADAKDRSEIRSPVDGIIKSLAVKTVGGVVQPGDVMVEIVPVDDSLMVDARLPVEDIGFVHAGQQAELSLTSSDSQQFGTITGEVVGVAPDALLTEQGTPYYLVRIRPSADSFATGRIQYRLYPGMRLVCNILIGERTVAGYVLDPLFRTTTTAMRER